MKLRYRPKAVADLDGIAEYTRAEWRDEKARVYMQTLRTACETIARFPQIGPRSLLPRYCRLMVESHAVYYRASKTEVIIVRILHERQEPVRNL